MNDFVKSVVISIPFEVFMYLYVMPILDTMKEFNLKQGSTPEQVDGPYFLLKLAIYVGTVFVVLIIYLIGKFVFRKIFKSDE